MTSNGSAKGLHLNIKESKLMTTEEIHITDTDHEDTATAQDFAHLSSVNNSNAGCSQDTKRRLRPGRATEE